MQIEFKSTIKRFNSQGEKTGWTYIEIPATLAQKMKPGNKKTFRVKGKLDGISVEAIALLPMGDGNFIMALNATIRKKLKKQKGAVVTVQLAEDESPVRINTELIQCLEDDPDAKTWFNSLTKGHQKYFSNWINAAKTETTRSVRIAASVNALSRKQNFGEMLRALTLQNKKVKGVSMLN